MKKPKMKLAMEKPKMKRAFAILTKRKNGGYLSFSASHTIAECAKEFGLVESLWGRRGEWAMAVSSCYDFDEVVEWLESFN